MPNQLRPYVYLTIGAGMAMLPFAILHIDPTVISIIILFGILAGLLDRYLVELPNGTFFSGTLAFTVITIVYIGIPEAVIVELIAFFISTPFINKQWAKRLYNLSQYMLCTWASGFIFITIGGQIGIFSLHDIWRILIVVAAYQIFNSAMLAVIIRFFQQRKYMSTFISMIEDTIYGYIVNSVIALFLYTIYPFVGKGIFIGVSLFIALTLLVLRYSFGMFIRLRKTYLKTLEAMTSLKEMKMELVEEGHANRVGRIARELAERLKLSQDDIDNIHYASLLHDIGKDYLDDQIFKRKSSSRTLDEEAEYQKHVEIGAKMVKDISGLSEAAEYIHSHHEKWDGSGFPNQKETIQIPLGARIIALANEYDHVMTKKKLVNRKEAFKKKSGTTLDPKLVNLFLTYASFSTDSYLDDKETSIQDTLMEKVIIEKSKQKFKESSLLKDFGAHLNVKYINGRFFDQLEHEIEIPAQAEVLKLIELTESNSSKTHDFIEEKESGKIFDVYCIPVADEIHVMLFDVSHILEYEKKQEERVHSLYRDVIYSVTEGKLVLADPKEVNDLNGEQLFEQTIEQTSDVTDTRKKVESFIEDVGMNKKESFQLKLCVSEVTTNVLKHANSGVVKMYKDNDLIKFYVKDTGDGIKLEDLPKSTLLPGYSSRKSLGHGFNLVLKYMDRVILNTSSQGTVVVLEKNLTTDADHEKLETKGVTTS